MMDNAGAVVGGLLAFGLLRMAEVPLRTVFAAAVVPGLAAVAVILLFVREPPQTTAPPVPRKPSAPSEASVAFPPLAIRYFVALAVFSLAGSGDMFLVLRLTELGLDVALVPIAWVSLQLGKALLNMPGGRAADRFGRRRLLVAGWGLYAIVYAGFGFVQSWAVGWLLLGVYATYYGMVEGGQRALIMEVVPPEAAGRAYGVQLAVEGIAVLPANVLFGLAYTYLGAKAAFGAAAALALMGAAILTTVQRDELTPRHRGRGR
jgi:MFS family permease